MNNGNNSVTHPHHGTEAQLREARSYLFRRLTAALHHPAPLPFLHPTTAADLGTALPALHGTLNGCGIIPISSGVTVSRSKGGAVLSGVKTCKSRWCPVCAAKVEAKEAWETRDTLLHLHHSGQLESRSMWHLVITMGHRREDDQRRNVVVFLEALEALISSRFWRRSAAGYLLKVEVEGDLSRNGLHPHAHVVLILDEGTKHPNPYDFAGEVRDRFQAELRKRGCNAGWGNILDWFRPVTDAVDLPRYLAKKGFPRWDVADELCSSQAKNGGFWRRNPEDLALCNAYTAGVRLLRAGGILKTARAHVRKLQEAQEPPQLIPVALIPSEAWKARPDLREPVQLLAESSLSPDVVEDLIAELFQLTPAQGSRFLHDIIPALYSRTA